MSCPNNMATKIYNYTMTIGSTTISVPEVQSACYFSLRALCVNTEVALIEPEVCWLSLAVIVQSRATELQYC